MKFKTSFSPPFVALYMDFSTSKGREVKLRLKLTFKIIKEFLESKCNSTIKLDLCLGTFNKKSLQNTLIILEVSESELAKEARFICHQNECQKINKKITIYFSILKARHHISNFSSKYRSLFNNIFPSNISRDVSALI